MGFSSIPIIRIYPWTMIHLKFLRCKTLHVPLPELSGRGREGDDGPGGWAATTPVVPHDDERFVVPDELV